MINLKPSQDDEFILTSSIQYDYQQFKLTQVTEIPVDKLSLDENDEASCMKSSVSAIFLKKNQKANAFLTTVTIIKTIVGSGILGIPYVLMSFGWLIGILLLLFFYLATQYIFLLLLKSKNLSGHSNFCTIGKICFGNAFRFVINAIFFINNFGVCSIEMVIFGTTSQNMLHQVFGLEDEWYYSTWFMSICMSILLAPLVYVNSIEKLKYVSLFAITSISLFSIVTIYNFGSQYNKLQSLPQGFNIWPTDFDFLNALSALPTVILAFLQVNFFPIYKTLENGNDSRMLKVSFAGLSCSGLLYVIVGLFGYATYGNQIKINYLESIDMDEIGKTLYAILNISFVISSTLSFPVIFFGGRNNLLSVIKEIRLWYYNKQQKKKGAINKVQVSGISFVEDDKINIKKKFTGIVEGWRFYLFTSIAYIIVITIAIVVGDIGPIFTYIGAITANSIAFLLPCLFYLKLSRQLGKNFIITLLLFALLVSLTILCIACEVMKEIIN